MKVILQQDVAKLGRRFTVVEVPDGYAANKLLPKGLAKPATPANLKALNARMAAADHQREAASEQFEALKAALADKTVIVTAAANAEGKLFQAVKSADVASEVSALTGMSVTAAQVSIHEPIKQVGEHMVAISEGSESLSLPVTIAAA